MQIVVDCISQFVNPTAVIANENRESYDEVAFCTSHRLDLDELYFLCFVCHLVFLPIHPVAAVPDLFILSSPSHFLLTIYTLIVLLLSQLLNLNINPEKHSQFTNYALVCRMQLALL